MCGEWCADAAIDTGDVLNSCSDSSVAPDNGVFPTAGDVREVERASVRVLGTNGDSCRRLSSDDRRMLCGRGFEYGVSVGACVLCDKNTLCVALCVGGSGIDEENEDDEERDVCNPVWCVCADAIVVFMRNVAFCVRVFKRAVLFCTSAVSDAPAAEICFCSECSVICDVFSMFATESAAAEDDISVVLSCIDEEIESCSGESISSECAELSPLCSPNVWCVCGEFCIRLLLFPTSCVCEAEYPLRCGCFGSEEESVCAVLSGNC